MAVHVHQLHRSAGPVPVAVEVWSSEVGWLDLEDGGPGSRKEDVREASAVRTHDGARASHGLNLVSELDLGEEPLLHLHADVLGGLLRQSTRHSGTKGERGGAEARGTTRERKGGQATKERGE